MVLFILQKKSFLFFKGKEKKKGGGDERGEIIYISCIEFFFYTQRFDKLSSCQHFQV